MIKRPKLGFYEISFPGYRKLLASRRGKEETSINPKGRGFARIDKPLRFNTYRDMLQAWRTDSFGKRASAPIKTKSKPWKWHRVDRRDLGSAEVETLLNLAEKVGFLYVSFVNQGDYRAWNEVAFRIVNCQCLSTALRIPGPERSLWGWDGSQVGFTDISALYTPNVRLGLDRKRVRLRKISRTRYLEVASAPDEVDAGFAFINKPWSFRTCWDLLNACKDTKEEVTVKMRKNLYRARELTSDQVDYIQSQFAVNDLEIILGGSEVIFSKKDTRVISKRIVLPGRERYKWQWRGSRRDYNRIYAVLRPNI